MNINKTRGLLYKIARILGDVQAAKNARSEKGWPVALQARQRIN